MATSETECNIQVKGVVRRPHHSRGTPSPLQLAVVAHRQASGNPQVVPAIDLEDVNASDGRDAEHGNLTPVSKEKRTQTREHTPAGTNSAVQSSIAAASSRVSRRRSLMRKARRKAMAAERGRSVSETIVDGGGSRKEETKKE
jgi:hypothetical protein